MANFSTLKEKILAFLAEMGIRKVDFYESTGIQSSNFKGTNLKSAPGGDMLVKILTLYPNLSAEWLMRDEGNMLRDTRNLPIKKVKEPTDKIESSTPPTNNLDPILEKFMSKIAEQGEEIGRLKERIAQLQREKNNPSVSLQTAPEVLSSSTVD